MATQLGNGALAAGSYGHFDPEQREYVIREPLTPLPWINYLGSTALYSIISNTGGGYSFYRDAKLRRLTRYRYDSVPLDSVGKYLYIADGDCTWNPGFRPSQTALDHYECRHGLGYTRFCSGKNGLHADVHVFVADEDDVELQVLTLRNDTPTAKKVQIFSFVEWCQWNAEDDGANLQRNLSLAGDCDIAISTHSETAVRSSRSARGRATPSPAAFAARPFRGSGRRWPSAFRGCRFP